MKYSTIVGFVAFLSIPWVGGVARADLRCAEAVVSLGSVKAGQPLSRRFTLINAGHDEVQITAVQPSCGCLKPRLEERRLRPGDSAVLVLEVNTLTAPAGPNSWRVQTMYTAGGQLLEITVELRATVVSEITVQPAALVLQTESSLGSDIVLTDARSTPLTVTGVRTTAPFLRASVTEPRVDANGRRVQVVHVDAESGVPDGRHDEMLQIYSSDPDYKELRVPVTVVKQSRQSVVANPAEVSIQLGSGPVPARVVLLRAPGQAVEVKQIECDDPAVRCTHARGPGDMSTLRVQIDRSKISADGLHTTLRVRLALPSVETLTIPVNCTTH